MSRSISSIPTSELSNLNFVDLDEQEMITLAGGSGSLVNVEANNLAQNGGIANNLAKNGGIANNLAQNLGKEGILVDVL